MVECLDLTTDPRIRGDLHLARRATSNFLRVLHQMRAGDLPGASTLPGVTRAEVVSLLGHQAREFAELCACLGKGAEADVQMRIIPAEVIRYGATLPPQALHNLFQHSAVHLDVEWRDLPEQLWSTPVRVEGAGDATPTQLLWNRAVDLWRATVILDLGESESFIPEQFRGQRRGELERLLLR